MGNGAKMIAGLREARAYMRGERTGARVSTVMVPIVDVKKFGISWA